MATGRGRLLRQLCLGLQALHLPLGGLVAAPGSGGFRKGPGDNFAAGCTTLKQSARHERSRERSSAHCSVSLDGLPSEILLKILSYLDAMTLLCTGCVNRRFYHLANDKSNWKVNSVEKTAEPVNVLSVEDKEAGYWKKEYVTKQIASVKAALAQVLKPVDPYTGLPVKTKEALRISGLGWVIILKEKGGKEYIMEHVDLSINDSSVSIVWYGKNWPRLATLSTLDLCGVTPVFMDRSKTPTKNRPRWHSLIAKYSLRDLPGSTVMGCDRIIRLFRLNPGLLVGLWKREEELAFVMATLHFHHLVERSTLGSATVPSELPAHTPLLDDSPEHGLHGFQLHVDMHSGGTSYLCSTFHNLFTKKVKRKCNFMKIESHMANPQPVVKLAGDYAVPFCMFLSIVTWSLDAEQGCIENGYVKLIVIRFKNNTEHLPLIGKVGFTWRTDIFDGYIKTYRVDYMDSTGQVHMELVWIEETEEYFIVSLVLYLSTAKINHWFGTQY